MYYDIKTKRYIYKKTIKGKRVTFYGSTEDEVFSKIENYTMQNVTLKDFAFEWFDTVKKNDYKVATYEKERRRLQTILRDDLGNYIISAIKTSQIQKYVEIWASKLTPKTIKNYMILLNGCFEYAVQLDIIQKNPCKYVSIPKLKKPEVVAFNNEQKEVFLKYASQSPYYDIFVFALNTGMRESEICGLTKDCVDFSSGFVMISKQLVRLKGKYILDTPKTETSIRKVPITSKAFEILKKFIESPYNNTEYVFFNPVSHTTLKQNALCENIRRVLDDCYAATNNSIFNKATFHSLRHTFATNWIVQGGNPTLLSKALGHTDTAFTLRVYVQPDFTDVKNAMSSLAF